MLAIGVRPCRECWKQFWPEEATEWVCRRCREQRKLVEWMSG